MSGDNWIKFDPIRSDQPGTSSEHNISYRAYEQSTRFFSYGRQNRESTIHAYRQIEREEVDESRERVP